MTTPCRRCRHCNGNKWRECKRYRQWLRAVWGSFDAEGFRQRCRYREHLRQMYTDATFRREE